MPKHYTDHVVIGAGGAIAHSLVPELVRQEERVTVVSRSGLSYPGTASVVADAMDADALSVAIPEGSAVYLLVGLPYQTIVWQEQWIPLIETVLKVCIEKGAFLLFFDNVYMYGPVDGVMTEDTPHNPTSEKGRVRQRVVDAILEAFGSGALDGVIARSADFYGPGANTNGIPNLLVLQRLVAGKSAQWLVNGDKLHSLTYTIDCGRALPLLVGDESSYNQVWHLPTAHPAVTMRRFVEIAAEVLNVKPRLSVMPRWMLSIGGFFDKTIKELPEMSYQYDRDYVFDSSKFESHFSFFPTSYAQGIRETLASIHH